MGFGASVERVDVWHTPPDFSDVKSAYTLVGALEAKLEILDIEISETKRQIKRGSRKADVSDEAEEATKERRAEYAKVRAELKVAQKELDFLVYWKEMYKSTAFANKG